MRRTNRLAVLGGVILGAAATAVYVQAPSSSAMAQQGEQQRERRGGGGSGVSVGGRSAEAITTKDISLDQAHAALMAAYEKARDMNVKMDIAVVDAGGNLKAFSRMDGAWLGSIDIAIKKAKTARYFDMPTGDIGKLSQPGEPLYQIEVSNQGLITFPGGVPIKSGDQIIGAIGVSGDTVEKDHEVAAAGAAAVR
jgi:uncharacterized protein GlcG (DUF336 family)